MHGVVSVRAHLSARSKVLAGAIVACLLVGVALLVIESTYGAQQLPERSLQIASSQTSASTNYKLDFTLATAGALGSIRVQFCANNPVINAPCAAPTGFDISSATLSSQSGETGFIISPTTTSNVLLLTRLPAIAAAQPVSYVLAGVTNPSSTGSYYARVQTYATTDASGANIDYGGLAFSIADLLTINAEVPPYLTFCTGISISGFDCNNAQGDYVNFGELSASATAKGQSQLLAGTNAANGYAISANGSTLTSGNNIINPLTIRDISRPGTSQFGLNLRANVTPAIGNDPAGAGAGLPTAGYNTANYYQFLPGDVVAGSPVADDYRLYTVSYINNVPSAQSPGIYVTTLTYVCLANF